MLRATIAACLLPPAALVLGCGEEQTPRASGPAAAAARVVTELEAATRARDWKLICTELYSEAVRDQAGGPGCPKLLERVNRELRNPSIEIESIALGEEAAAVRVTTLAAGQAPVPETIQLERDEDGSFRIAGLGGLELSPGG